MAASSSTLTFPLYSMRGYESMDIEGLYTVITAYRGRYVLDCPSLEGNYWVRRLAMANMDLPYPLYRLNKRVVDMTQLLQLIVRNRRTFIDVNGKLQKYMPQKYYPLIYAHITSKWVTKIGTIAFKCKGSSHTFTSAVDKEYSYLGYVDMGGKHILYELCWEKKRNTVRKL